MIQKLRIVSMFFHEDTSWLYDRKLSPLQKAWISILHLLYWPDRNIGKWHLNCTIYQTKNNVKRRITRRQQRWQILGSIPEYSLQHSDLKVKCWSLAVNGGLFWYADHNVNNNSGEKLSVYTWTIGHVCTVSTVPSSNTLMGQWINLWNMKIVI